MFGSAMNQIHANSTNPEPAVGMGATVLHWSDRDAGTIIEVAKNGKTIVVQLDHTARTDTNGMSDCQDYEYERDENGRKYTFTLRRNGRWVRKGEDMHGVACGIGYRKHYYDYSF